MRIILVLASNSCLKNEMTTQKQTQKKRPRGWFPEIRGRGRKGNIINNIMISLNGDR